MPNPRNEVWLNTPRAWSLIAITPGLLVLWGVGMACAEGGTTFTSPEARQGVAVDAIHVYTINDAAIAKHDKATGALVERWEAEEAAAGEEAGFIHMNSGVVRDDRLYCAHSNYPAVPMRSSIEVFSLNPLAPVDRIDLGETDGSLTWMDWHDGYWWGCFAHYSHRPPEEKSNRDTTLVQLDAEWNRLRAWRFPGTLMERCAPYSLSGGSWGPGGLLYVTGHDRPEVYVLALPDTGGILEYQGMVSVPMEGQAIAFDRSGGGELYGIVRRSLRVVTAPSEVFMRAPAPPPLGPAATPE